MYDKCSKSLAIHAAEVFATMTGHKPTLRGTKLTDHDSLMPNYTLGERVDFQGKSADGGKVEGYFICAFETMVSARLFAKDIASYLGLSAVDANNETDSFVGEFLNVVIGLTCSAWADHGFRVEFNPPQILKEHVIDTGTKPGVFYLLVISAEGFYQTSIFLHFYLDTD
ncbi:MAG: hypothetical protein LBR53_05060 [Deltaproteobacteria bacterium]|jgi:hypothetical protein|nr:hypothetical protein [Deltaproteobacteria bacterium]